ncbi:MAG TPA: signal peptidase I [Candidatus Eubacterium avistercoris]|uniref:Signal peptidase I n=1 Tax=Candidatus Eubacterium avistercoris TaxID=2838567 RepID=A0A9D2D543_9FIRM|nr:signal peptidase I [Candidatus Eubacterium avistercoris]
MRLNLRSRGGLNFSRRRHRIDRKTVKKIISWLVEIVIVLAVAYALVYSLGMRVTVAESSMVPTLENGDRVLVNRVIYHVQSPKAGDIVAFYPNGNEKSRYYIKRIIGEPGDTIQIQDGVVYVNGDALESANRESIENAGLAEEPVTVGEDEYFVLGDNRNNSEDSRYASIGNVKKEDIAGKVWFQTYPRNSMGRVE